MQDLDLFLYKEIQVRNKNIENGKPRKTNVLIEAMHCGFEQMIDYIFSESFSNIRAIVKRNNQLEIENEVALFNISYFLTHINNNPALMKKLYFNLIDLM